MNRRSAAAADGPGRATSVVPAAAGPDDTVWRALSSSHRRRILDLLRDGPRTTGELAAHMDGLSRFAVMQHLGVLVEADLVLVRRRGRERFNHLNAIPIRQIEDRWVSAFAGRAADEALALKRHVEEGQAKGDTMAQATTTSRPRAVRLEHEMRVRASRERVWEALTTEQLEWYPHTYGLDRVKGLIFEGRVGGRVAEDWGDGVGMLYSHIWHWEPPVTYCVRGFLHGATNLEQWVSLEEDGDETIVRSSTVAFGDLTDEQAEQIRTHGDMSLYEDVLKAYVERPAKAG